MRIVDRVAYINHDIDDAIRHGILSRDQLPDDEIAILGDTGSERIDSLVHDIVESSERSGDITQATRSAKPCFRFEPSCSTACISARTRASSTTRAHDRLADLP